MITTDRPISKCCGARAKPDMVRQRFEAKTAKAANSDCLLWTGKRDREGYGRVKIGGKERSAHRVAYELSGRELIAGMTIDHLCRVHHCVNPTHLEQVTRGENVLRGMNQAAARKRQTHCKNGHPLSGDNLRVYRTHRTCKTCTSACAKGRPNKQDKFYWREYRRKRKEQGRPL